MQLLGSLRRSALSAKQYSDGVHIIRRNFARPSVRIVRPLGTGREKPHRKQRRGNSMALFRRGRFWWFEFWYRGQRIRRSTKLSNKKKARDAESAVRTALARGDFGILERKPVPTLSEFIESRFEPWAKAQFEKPSPATWFRYYRTN